jgi:lysozyme family protein
MTTSNFEAALKYCLIDEGGNSDDPRDHGGRTSKGITQQVYDSWCRLNNKSSGDVWQASDADIKSIYKDQYWKPYCDEMPDGIDYLFFDMAVNTGRQQAVKTLQKALNVPADGMMGQVTWASVDNIADIPSVIRDISEYRRTFYRHLRQFPIYGKGWLNRVDHAEKGALALFNASSYKTSYVPIEHVGGTQKADPADVAKSTVSPETSSTVTMGSGGLLAIIQQFKETLAPYAHEIKYVTYALMGVAFAGLAYSVWGFYKKSKVNQAVIA